MRARYAIAAGLWFMVICSARAEDCAQVGKDASTKTSIEYVQKIIVNSKYSCAVQMTARLARSFASLPNRNGFDARFALRELALEEDKNRSIPLSFRVKLTESAAGSLQRNKPIPSVELIADVRFLLDAMNVFQQQSETGGWLDLLGDSIQLNQQLPQGEGAIQPRELNGIDKVAQEFVYKNYSAEKWDKLIKIAEITRGDKNLLAFRSQFASWFNYWVPGNYDNRSREEIIARSNYILQLTEQLNDAPARFPTTYQCNTGRVGDQGCLMDWQSRPYIRAGLAFHHVGMQDKAKHYVDKGLKVIESEKNLEIRLGLYEFAIRDLMRAHYDRTTLLDATEKMQTLADSIGPKYSKDVRSLSKEVRLSLSKKPYGGW